MHSYVATPGCPPALETKGIPEFNRPANQPKVVATPDGPLNTGLNSSSIQSRKIHTKETVVEPERR
jgi:hypothetical protein